MAKHLENLYHRDIFPAHDVIPFTKPSHNSQHTPIHHYTFML
nr:MAG TPA: hypothetical protein [Caudoviricetes sp.]